MKNQHLLLASLLVLLVTKIYSQSYIDIINIGYEHSEFSPETGPNFNFDRFRAQINPGLELKNGDYILGTLSTELFKFNDVDFTGNEFDLYSSFLTAGYLHFWNDRKWSLLAQVRFKANSDKFQPVIDEIQTGGWFMFTYYKTGELNIFGGMYFNQEVYKTIIIPIGGIHWKPEGNWNLYILVPSLVRFEYELSKNNWYTGIESNWNLNSFVINKNQDIDYFRRETLVTTLFLEKHLTEKLVLSTSIGHYQINDFEAFDRTDQLISPPQLQSNLFKNISLQAGLSYRMRF